MALNAAKRDGNAKPAWILAVATSRASGMRVATPGDTVPGAGHQAVYLVVMKGNFTFYGVAPPGGRNPTGHYLSVTIDRATLQTLDIGLSDHPPAVSLSSLGPVTDLLQRE